MAIEPRSGEIEVGGVSWLGRMIDKARLEAAGELDIHDLDFPCPLDTNLMSRLGIDAHTFRQIIAKAPNDTDVLQAMCDVGAKLPG